MLIPENFIDFLYWFKNVTEATWAKESQKENDPILSNAKWVGMEERQIDEIEKKFLIKFPDDHRHFLRILHTLNIKPSKEHDFYFNWLEDEEYVTTKLNWLHRSISMDKIWLCSWGDRPDSEEATKRKFDQWYKDAPQLIPLFGHRYMVSKPFSANNPVLSVRGSDTIIYGWDLKDYLLREFTAYLPIDLFQRRYEEEGDYWEYEFNEEIQDFFDKKWLESNYDNIPFWGELIKQSEGNWKYEPRNRK